MDKPLQRDIFLNIKTRRSVRSFLEKKVEEEKIRKVIEAASCAPSSGNSQPWKFIVLQERASIRELARGVREAVSNWEEQMEKTFADAIRQYVRYFSLFEGAPCLIVPIYRPPLFFSSLPAAGDEKGREDMMRRGEEDSLISVSAAVQNLMLCAHSLGLGTCLMTGPLIAKKAIRKALDVPPSWRVHSVVPIGYPKGPVLATKRKKLDFIIKFHQAEIDGP